MIDEYVKRFANQIAEANSQGNFNTPQIIANSLRLSRVATQRDFADFKEAFKDYDHGLGSWKKWGGGNKMGTGGAAVNAARRARADARRSAPDANVNNYVNKNLFDRIGLTPVSNFLDSRLNDVQGKFMPSNPSFVGVGANPSYGVPSIGSFNNVSSFSNFTGGLPSFDQSSVELFSLSDPSSASSSFRAAGDVFGKFGSGSGVPFADEIPIPLALPVDNYSSSFSPSNYLVLGRPYSRISYNYY